MLLLRIESDGSDAIDQALVVVPDDFDREFVLNQVADVVPNPTIVEQARIEAMPGFCGDFCEYRPFFG
jgi:hypothetical protein